VINRSAGGEKNVFQPTIWRNFLSKKHLASGWGLSDANFLLRACKVRSLLPSFQLVRSTQLCETEKAPAERHFCRVPAKNADIYRLETRTVR